MRRIKNEEKQTNTSIKSEKEKIVSSINASNVVLEGLKKEIKCSKEELSYKKESIEAWEDRKEELKMEIVKLSEEKGLEKKELSILDDELNDKRDKLDKLDGSLEKKEEENMLKLQAMIEPKMKEFNELNGSIVDINRLIGLNVETKKKFETQLSELEDSLSVKKIELEELDKESNLLEVSIKDALEDLEGLKSEKEDIQKIEDESLELKQENLKVQKEIDSFRNELSKLEKEKAKRFDVIESKEREINRREERITNREEGLDDREKDIDLKAETLQKHYDKQNMPIKVF